MKSVQTDLAFGRLASCAFLAMSTLLSAATAPERSSIPDGDKWDLTAMYASSAAFEEHFQKVEGMITAFARRQGTAAASPSALLDTLKARDEINVQFEKISAFAAMRRDEDMREAPMQALYQRAQTLGVKWGEAAAWFQPELLKVPEAQLRVWLTQQDLQVYTHYVDDLLRSKTHILSPREEELLAMAGKATEAATDAFSLLSNTELRWRTAKDAQGREVQITASSFYQAMYAKDRRYRQEAFTGLYDSHLDVKNTLAATLAGAFQRDWFYAKARGYSSCLQAALDAENLPESVYHNLIATVNAQTRLLHRYVALKKKVLKLGDGVHLYDLYVNLVDVPEKAYTFEQARELVLEGIQPFGPEYAQMMKKAFASRWIDIHPNQGKRSGAYNMGTYLSAPYVLLNFQGTFNDVSTTAHELGHAMQSWFAKETQPAVYAGYPMFTAEVASTAAEIVFKKAILAKTQDPKERAYLINQMLEDMRGTLFRQTQFAEFDLAAHTLAEKGEPMTADVLMKITRDIYARYYGPDFVIDPALEVESLRIPHYYRNYYVYRYATSYCAAAAIAKRMLDQGPGAREDWMKFLRAGNSMYAIDMLKVAGVDMTTPKPVADALALFEQLLADLEKLLGV